jgi:hypothetical protein
MNPSEGETVLSILTLNMRKRTKNTPRTIARLLHIVALGRLVNLRMKLLFGARMTVLTILARLTVVGFAPLLAVLHIRTRRRTVLELARTASLVFAVVVLRTRIALSAETRRSFARFGFVVGQHIVGVLPLGILVHEVALFVEDVGSPIGHIAIAAGDGFGAVFGTLECFDLFDVVDGRTLVVDAVGECTVGAVFDAVAARVCVMYTHTCFVVS